MLGDESIGRGHQQRSVSLPETTDGVREQGWRQGYEAGDVRNRIRETPVEDDCLWLKGES